MTGGRRSVTARASTRRRGTVSAPVATTSRAGGSRASVRSTPTAGGASIVIRHKEYVRDVAGNTGTSILREKVSPVNVRLFPYLSALARNFGKYSFRSIRFEYKPSCPTSTTGTIGLCFDPDPRDHPPVDKSEFLSHESSQRSAPWSSCSVSAPPAALARTGVLFMETDTPGEVSNPRLTAAGEFYTMADSQASTADVGELWVEYTCVLYAPSLRGDTGSIYDKSCYIFSPAADNTDPFAGYTTLNGGLFSAEDIISRPGVDSSLFFPNRTRDYLMAVSVTGSGIANPAIACAWYTGTGCTVAEIPFVGVVSGGATSNCSLWNVHVEFDPAIERPEMSITASACTTTTAIRFRACAFEEQES